MLSNGFTINNPEARIREYCAIEIYKGYDDRHSIDDSVTIRDIEAANKLYALINRYDPLQSSKILGNAQLTPLLHNLPNESLGDLSATEWDEIKGKIRPLLSEFMSINGVGLARSVKILHLKRPNLFPILDSFVVRFLTNKDVSGISKSSLLNIGLMALDISRNDIVYNKQAFHNLKNRLLDLPIPLTVVRIYDILCWTTEKWVVRGNRHAAFGTAGMSISSDGAFSAPINQKIVPAKSVQPILPKSKGIYVVFEDYDKAVCPRLHTIECAYYARWLSNPTTTTTWHGPYETYEAAWNICQRLSRQTSFSPSRHRCVHD